MKGTLDAPRPRRLPLRAAAADPRARKAYFVGSEVAWMSSVFVGSSVAWMSPRVVTSPSATSVSTGSDVAWMSSGLTIDLSLMVIRSPLGALRVWIGRARPVTPPRVAGRALDRSPQFAGARPLRADPSAPRRDGSTALEDGRRR